jgi:hypothetical protein
MNYFVCKTWTSFRTQVNAPIISFPSQLPNLGSSACQRRHAFEHKLLHAIAGGSHVDVAFCIGGDLVAASQHARALDSSDNLQRFALDDCDFLTVSNVQELLFRVGRQRQIPRKRSAGLNQLLYELAVACEHLHASVFAIGYVHCSVVGYADGMHDAEILRARGIREARFGNIFTMIVIHRFVGEGAPHSFERAGIASKTMTR